MLNNQHGNEIGHDIVVSYSLAVRVFLRAVAAALTGDPMIHINIVTAITKLSGI